MIIGAITLVVGLYMVILGRTGLKREGPLTGTSARIAGLILLAPLLLTLGVTVVSDAQDREISETTEAMLNAQAYHGIAIALAYISFHTTSQEAKSRGGCLTVWLPAIPIAGALSIYMALQLDPSARAWTLGTSAFTAALQIVSAVGVWQWKRWGVYGLIGAYLLGGALAVIGDSPAVWVLVQTVGYLITLYLLVAPRWHFFDSQDPAVRDRAHDPSAQDGIQEEQDQHQAGHREDDVDDERDGDGPEATQ